MKELVTTGQAEQALRLLALALPVLGLLVGLIVGAVRRRISSSVLAGLLTGLLGPAAFGLWHIYNGIMGRYGLDSVKALLLNLAVFVAFGLIAGLVVGRQLRRQAAGPR